MANEPIFHSRPSIGDDDRRAIADVVKSGMIASGKMVKRFESELCLYVQGLTSRATSSGRNALLLALITIDAGPGDEIIIPTYVCRSVMEAVAFVGAKPVIADIGDDYCISADDVRKKVTNRTKAIVVVHIFGIAANMSDFMTLAHEHGIYVIEDCAQAIGGDVQGQRIGSLGHMSFFSFQATKVITTGEGGMLVLNNEQLLPRLQDRVDSKGISFAMSDIQASLGLSQLRKLPQFVRRRNVLAQQYIDLLGALTAIDIPIRDMARSMFFRFPVRVHIAYDFDRLRKELERQGVHVRKGVDLMLHQITKDVLCPKADLVFNETVSLPIYPSLKSSEAKTVASAFKKALKEAS